MPPSFTSLDCRGLALPAAHHRLGAAVKPQVHRLLCYRLARLSPAAAAAQFAAARACQSALHARLADPALPSLIRQALADYLACLAAWAAGAELLTAAQTAAQAGLPALTALDLAFFLQHDAYGCQTGLFRLPDGSALLWHTEEDQSLPGFGSRFDQLRLFTFTVDAPAGRQEVSAFIYPDLLPGPAFAWRSDPYVLALDAIYIRSQPAPPPGLLVNLASWVALRLGPQIELPALIQALAPFIDGCALNALFAAPPGASDHPSAAAWRVEFACDRQVSAALPARPGAYLFQVNALSAPAHALLGPLEDLTPAERAGLHARYAWTARRLDALPARPPADYFSYFWQLMASPEGGDQAYANPAVQACCLAHLAPGGLRLALAPGPALPTPPPIRVIRPPRG